MKADLVMLKPPNFATVSTRVSKENPSWIPVLALRLQHFLMLSIFFLHIVVFFIFYHTHTFTDPFTCMLSNLK